MAQYNGNEYWNQQPPQQDHSYNFEVPEDFGFQSFDGAPTNVPVGASPSVYPNVPYSAADNVYTGQVYDPNLMPKVDQFGQGEGGGEFDDEAPLLEEQVLKDYETMYENYLLNKIVLDTAIEIAHDNSSPNDINKAKINQILIDLEIQEYIALSKETENADDFKCLLNLSHEEVKGLSNSEASIFNKHLMETLKTKLSSDLDEYDKMCNGELSNPTTDDLNSQRIDLYDKLSENYPVLGKKKEERLKLYEKFLELKGNIKEFDEEYSLRILNQEHVQEDQKISLLNDVIEREVYKTPHAMNASAIVLGDMEREIKAIENKLLELGV